MSATDPLLSTPLWFRWALFLGATGAGVLLGWATAPGSRPEPPAASTLEDQVLAELLAHPPGDAEAQRALSFLATRHPDGRLRTWAAAELERLRHPVPSPTESPVVEPIRPPPTRAVVVTPMAPAPDPTASSRAPLPTAAPSSPSQAAARLASAVQGALQALPTAESPAAPSVPATDTGAPPPLEEEAAAEEEEVVVPVPLIPTARIDTIDTVEVLHDAVTVEAALGDLGPAVDACWSDSVARLEAPFEGDLEVAFRLHQGRPALVTVAPPAPDPALTPCLQRAIRSADFGDDARGRAHLVVALAAATAP